MTQRLKSVFLLLMLGSTLLWGYEDYLFHDYVITENYSLYDLVENPALLRLNNHEDLMTYTFSAGQRENEYRRTFDPGKIETGDIEIQTYKALDDRSALYSIIIYKTSAYRDVYRSLEKDFYSNYFSYTDTTTGDISYAGPQLRVLYNREIKTNFYTGLQIDYGIERGLKDVYTKCETIARNINIGWGMGYRNQKGSAAGFSIRYFQRQKSYEAVKEITDAVVNTYMGFNIYYPELPRSTNEKKTYEQGFELNGQMAKRGFLLQSITLDLSGGYGRKENDIDAGSSTKPTRRGYWVRDGGFVNSIITYINPRSQFQLVMMTNLKKYNDWASPQDYDVLNIKNHVNDMSLGIKTVVPVRALRWTVAYEFGIQDVNYHEYTADFNFEKALSRYSVSTDLNWRINQVLQLNCGIHFSEFEPWFYWNTNSIKTQGVEIGIQRLFVFGNVGATLQADVWKPDNYSREIQQFGLAISYWK